MTSTEPNVAPLFAPLKIAGKRLRNRVVMPPMVVCRGLATPESREWYAGHARGGVGLVIVEATSVTDFSASTTPEALAEFVDAIHAEGALVAIQLFPGTFGQRVTPADVTTEWIEKLLTDYQTAGAMCLDAGFDGLEPHGAHGYLLNQFFSPEQNRREDAYGGSPERRMRFALEVLGVLRPLADAHGAWLLYRHTPVGPGYGMDESIQFARALVEAGVDILDISPASDQAPADRAAPFRALGVPVIGVNEMDRVPRALEALREGRADLIAVGKALIADPEWPNKVREGRLDEVERCTHCNGCFEDLAEGIPVGCRYRRLRNETAGRP